MVGFTSAHVSGSKATWLHIGRHPKELRAVRRRHLDQRHTGARHRNHGELFDDVPSGSDRRFRLIGPLVTLTSHPAVATPS